MVLRSIAGASVTLLVWLVTLLTWNALSHDETQKIARIAEAESFAARSRLVTRVERQVRSLDDLARHWETFGHLPRDQWASEAQIELAHFRGIELIAWIDVERGVRFATGPDDLGLELRPGDHRWHWAQHFLERVDPAKGPLMLGPTRGDDGNYSFLIQLPVNHGVLVALVNANTLFDDLLRAQSPGYAIGIYWGGEQLYKRGQPAPDLPEAWRQTGLIQLPLGPLWRVTHQPTQELVGSLSGPALAWLLAAGLAIGVLAGVLVVQNGRVRQRARSAERAERQLAGLNAHLEELVDLRTRELAERTADLETISESVSHDLRNPLNTISLSVHVLSREQGQVQGREQAQPTLALERILRAKEQMLQILDRLRCFSQVSYVTFRREPILMTALARELADEFRHSEPPPQPDIQVGDLPDCEGDPTLVRTLLVNLIGNACKYSRDRQDRRIEVGACGANGPTTYFVRDNGVGFDPDKAGELFEPFARLGIRDRFEGQGVGLAVAARVVRRHGGRIWASSVPGQGATFFFELAPRGAREVADIDESQFAPKA